MLPTERLTVDKLISDPFFVDAELEDLPLSFWQHTSRRELVKLIGRFGVKGVLGQVQKSGLPTNLVIDKKKDLILYSDAARTAEGVKFTTIFEEYLEEFDLNDVDEVFFANFKSLIISGLKVAKTLRQMNEGTLFKLTRFYFPWLGDAFSGHSSVTLDMLLKQAVQRFLEQLLANEGISGAKSEYESLIEQVLHSHKDVFDGVLNDPLNPTFLPGSMRASLLEKLIVHKLYELEQTSPSAALRYLLSDVYLENGLVGKNMVPELLSHLIDRHTLNIMTKKDWSIIASYYDHRPLTSIVLTGIMIGTLDAAHTSDPAFFNAIVRREQYDQLIIGREVELLAKPFTWISVAKHTITFPDLIIDALLADHKASHIAQECLLKHLAVDGVRSIQPWFWKLIGSGSAKVHSANIAFKKFIIDANLELGYLAFPEEFDGNPPPTFKKSTLMEYVALGPVDGTRRHINAMMSKLVLLRLDVLTMEELSLLQNWAAQSRLSYILGTSTLIFTL